MILLIVLILSLASKVQSFSAICFGELLLDLPTRYLHIQLVDESGANITESRGIITSSVESKDCHLSHDVVDSGDGSYTFRLRVGGSCRNVTIRLEINGTSICDSPFHIQAKHDRYLNGEDCNCPIPIEEWLDEAECREEPQLDADLSHWEYIDFAEVLKEAEELWGGEEYRRTYSICHYQIIDNKVFRRCYGEYDGFKTFVDRIFISVLSKIRVPNTEFVFNLGDYPLSYPKQKLPVVSWCGSKNTFDIVLPTYQFSNNILAEHVSDDDIHSISMENMKWEQKIPKAIFRGRDSNLLRLHLAKLSSENPEGILDAGITNYFFHEEKEHTPVSKRVDFKDFFKYKYVLSVDGTVAAYRFPLLLAGNSLVFKSDSEYYEHFYSKMEPFVHYIPFNEQNIMERLQWAEARDHNFTLSSMKQFFFDHLQPKNMYCYFAKFLKKYTDKLVRRPSRVAERMEPASEKQHGYGCSCGKKGEKEEL